MIATTATDYRKFDTVTFQHYRADGDYEFAPVLDGMVTKVEDGRIHVAYSEPPRFAGNAAIGRVAVINPQMVPVTRVARYEG
jgi:hypothetical protein